MFELEIIKAHSLKEVKLITVEARLSGNIDSPLIKKVLVDKEQNDKRFFLKGPIFVDGPNVKRMKDYLYLAFDGVDYTSEDMIGGILVPLHE
ncbi:hypothetical protein GCM10010912_36780 [Paenibacillus albidus]|uniref:Uncharacterized protein n=1 Tax=Paenibacillus albidus TaxID=2041023 RepID=A0A917FJ08_9BACL|nr:hypothetical protein [Paenibacillus albidus]GGF88152.1 hypothetical protein GCM10010912_36780 [Paenibacillus albidus]